jgi:cyclase
LLRSGTPETGRDRRQYEKQKADELVFLDIQQAMKAAGQCRVVRRVAANIFMPFTVGGGIRGLQISATC